MGFFQIVRMLILIVVLFVGCWGPLLVFNVLQSLDLVGNYGVLIGTEKHIKTTFSLMAYFNSCLNPIIYGFMSKNFRESFLFSLRRLCRLRGRSGHSSRAAAACQKTAANKLCCCCRDPSPELEANRSLGQIQSRRPNSPWGENGKQDELATEKLLPPPGLDGTPKIPDGYLE